MSLDAPLVAVLWQALFLRCFHAEVNTLSAILLVLAVWLIYAADRSLDARSETGRLPRHEFYRHHWRAVLPVWTAVLATTGWLAWEWLPPLLFERGLILSVGVVIYFAAVHLMRRTWPKEAAVAVLFALGASLAAWNQIRSAADIATILLFSCLCWINCVAIKQWESHENLGWPIGLLALCVAFAAMILLYGRRPVLSGAEIASALALALIHYGRRRFSSDALRVLADVALLSPLLFLPLARVLD